MIDRKAHWQNIYQEKSPLEVSWYQREPRLSLELIQRSGIHPGEAVIDVGGGASVLVDSLLKKGFTRISVLDVSDSALISAKNRIGAGAKNIEWIEADITEFSPPHTYSLWHDRAVFHFLTDALDRRKYTDTLKQALSQGGHLIIAAFAIGGPERCSGLDVVQYDAAKLMGELGDEFELEEEIDEIHTTPSNKEQKFIYFRLMRR